MPLMTVGTVATAVGIVWQFWRVPVRLWEWHRAEEVEPAVGQIWREASLGGPNVDWQVIEVREEPWHIFLKSTTIKDSFGDFEEVNMDLETWEHVYLKKRRLYCKDSKSSIEDTYWGDVAEE
jgi:hypothetical protein